MSTQVLNSEFLWVVEFYREGCGYCQLLTPEWEKVAANLKHMVIPPRRAVAHAF